MASFNKVILAGNLVRDPETRYTTTGKAIGKFSLAINRRWKSESGEMMEEVTYVDVDAFGKSAETIAQYCRKGSGILVEGRLKLEQWEDKQTGQKRSRLGVVLESFQFIGGKQEKQGEHDDVQKDWPKRNDAASPAAGESVPDDDVPF